MIMNGYRCDDKGTRIDRFHLEQAIMEAWQISTDIKMVYQQLGWDERRPSDGGC
jgi:hypothetical protein